LARFQGLESGSIDFAELVKFRWDLWLKSMLQKYATYNLFCSPTNQTKLYILYSCDLTFFVFYYPKSLKSLFAK